MFMREDPTAPSSQAEVKDSTLGTPVVELRQVTCAYDEGREAISKISLSAHQGEVLCVLGPSGCGKTTTLRVIAGFESVTEGEVYLNGRLVSAPGHLIPAEQRRVGMVFQEYALFPHLRVEDNIAFGLQHLARDQRKAQVHQMLVLTGLVGLEKRYPHELSGGQQQRVALSRALAQNPVILLLDEPFSNLDPDMASRMRHDLHDLLKRTKTTAVLVTHDHEEAFAMADRVAVLNEGCLEQFDTPETIYHVPSSPFVADFVGQADFIPGVVRDGTVLTEIGEFPNQAGYRNDTKLVVMIRPEHASFPGSFAGRKTSIRSAYARGWSSTAVSPRPVCIRPARPLSFKSWPHTLCSSNKAMNLLSASSHRNKQVPNPYLSTSVFPSL
jgi:iron(III) transport system ATP-binding protein